MAPSDLTMRQRMDRLVDVQTTFLQLGKPPDKAHEMAVKIEANAYRQSQTAREWDAIIARDVAAVRYRQRRKYHERIFKQSKKNLKRKRNDARG